MYTYIYIYKYNTNIYNVLLYIFINFFLIGIYLSFLQIDFFTAFLWLLECTVIFVFLLLLFFLNVKGYLFFTKSVIYTYIYIFIYMYFIFIIDFREQFYWNNINILYFFLIDNFFEGISNYISNDMIGFLITYYYLNSVEFLFVGFLLLVGSVVCIKFNQNKKNVSLQNYNNFLKVFNFFENFLSFCFLRKQNMIKQGNIKSSTKIFKKK